MVLTLLGLFAYANTFINLTVRMFLHMLFGWDKEYRQMFTKEQHAQYRHFAWSLVISILALIFSISVAIRVSL